MKKLLLLLLIAPVLVIAQGEQRYADGTATDQDGNTFEWINYGTQDWAIENAAVETYRDGTVIPYVTSPDWYNLTTGAWRYYDDDPGKGKLYNWYAVMGINDNYSSTPPKEFAPEGWHIPSDAEWTIFEDYLVSSGYDIPVSGPGSSIAKALASKNGWSFSDGSSDAAYGNYPEYLPGYNQTTNNTSGFNAFPTGGWYGDHFQNEGYDSTFWTTTESNIGISYAEMRWISNTSVILRGHELKKINGLQVRFVRDASTASTNDYSNAVAIYPNPTTSILTIEGNIEYQIKVYDLLGNKVLETQGNSVNMEHLSTATYIVKATDKSNNEELTYKVVKN